MPSIKYQSPLSYNEWLLLLLGCFSRVWLCETLWTVAHHTPLSMQRVDSLEKTDAGRDWGQEEKGMTEDEMAGWHHRLDGRESEWTPGVGDGQGGLACCDSWGRKESDTTEPLNWTELNHRIAFAIWHLIWSNPSLSQTFPQVIQPGIL